MRTAATIGAILPPGWHVRKEAPVRIPDYDEPEPDLSVARGTIEDYQTAHPGPGDIAMTVEVSRSTLSDDRKLAAVYAAGQVPAYWIVNVPKRRLEVYESSVGGQYPAPRILRETDSVDLVIGGQLVGRIAVADLLPRP
jgi:hypothetical protein